MTKIVLLFVCSLFIFPGCSETKPKTDTTATKKEKSKKTEKKRLCEDTLNNVLGVVNIENLSEPIQHSHGVLFLNDWKQECQVEGDPVISELSQTLLKNAYSPDAIERLQRNKFDSRDVTHLQTALLFRKMALNTIDGIDNDLQRVLALYELTIRNISINKTFAERVPRTPYDSMLFSFGGVEDRILIFSMLLRQLHIDSFIIRPNAETPYPLIGVALKNNVYLFEPTFGVPVAPSNEKNPKPFIELPATLKQLRENSKLLEQFSVSDEKYPLLKSDFKKIRIDLIGDSSYFAPRMEPFESRLKGSETCTIYSAIESTDAERELGMVNRILKNGGLDQKNISLAIWVFPEMMYQRYENPSEDEKKMMQFAHQMFEAIFTSTTQDTSDDKNVAETKQDRKFLKARTKHLSGDYETSIQAYQGLRIGGLKARSRNDAESAAKISMGEKAHYWAGLSQFEAKKYKIVTDTMNSLIRENSKGTQVGPAQILRAMAYAKQNQLKEAITAMKEYPENFAESGMARYYIKRWEKIAGVEKKPAEKKSTEKKPADKKTNNKKADEKKSEEKQPKEKKDSVKKDSDKDQPKKEK